MSDPQSITALSQWLATFRQLGDNENTASEQVAEHLDALSEVLTDMAIDYELHGMETFELKVLIAKQRAYQNRILPKRFEVVDALMPLAARLVRQSELPAETKSGDAPADPWVLVDLSHCKGHRSTFSRAKDDPATTGVQKIGHGKYEIRRSRLAEYLEVRHRSKYGIE